MSKNDSSPAQVVPFEGFRMAQDVMERSRTLARVIKNAALPYDVPMVYATMMFAATICRAMKLDKATFLKWAETSWEARVAIEAKRKA